MAKYGLLQGLGMGLSQGSQLLAQGMSEDREVERQRMREASIEKRWQRQEQKDDARYADSVKFREEEVKRQKERDTVNDGRYADSKKNDDRRLSLAESQADSANQDRELTRIESNIQGVMQSNARAEQKEIDRYTRLMSRESITEGELKALESQLQDSIKAIRADGDLQLNGYVAGYGDKLRGTAFSYLLDQKQANTDPTDPQTTQNILSDLGGGKVVNGRGSVVSDIIGNAEQAVSAPQVRGGLLDPGFIGGFKQSMAGDNEPLNIDYSQMSPAQRISTAGGRAVGYFPGKLRDVAEVANESAIQPAWQWLNAPQKR